MELAAPLAVSTVQDFLKTKTSIEVVRFVCFSSNDYEVYQKLIG